MVAYMFLLTLEDEIHVLAQSNVFLFYAIYSNLYELKRQKQGLRNLCNSLACVICIAETLSEQYGSLISSVLKKPTSFIKCGAAMESKWSGGKMMK